MNDRSSAFRDFERQVHDRIADGYHRAFTPVTERAHPLLLRAASVGRGDRVLDVACGPGALAGKAAALGAEVTGVDLAPAMVDLARRLHPGLRFEAASADDLPLPDASMDVVLCSFGIGHFPEPDRGFAEFARVLKPGGRIAVSWWEVPERSRINGVFFDALQEERIRIPDTLPPGPGAFVFSQDEALRNAFTTAGFAAPDIAVEEGVHALPGFDALWELARNSFARLGTIIAGLDEAERGRFRKAVAARAARYGTAPLEIPIAFRVASSRKPD